jgi:mono/diheme cytochrome c family protein
LPGPEVMRSWLLGGAPAVIVAVLLAMQVVPYRQDRENPPVLAEPAWDRPVTRALAARACFDCHSNETAWPWYSKVAPISWLLDRDVGAGRTAFNMSEWTDPAPNALAAAARRVRSGEMHPWYYRLVRRTARLSTAERAELARGLEAMFGAAPQRSEGPPGEDPD